MTIYLDIGSFVFGAVGTSFFIGLLMAVVAAKEAEFRRR